MSHKHIIDPLINYNNNVEEQQTLNPIDFTVTQHLDTSFFLHLGFLNDIILWNVKNYEFFLENISRNIYCEYHFMVGVNEPCTWIYKNGYLFYTVWDCGQWFDSYKIKMCNELLTKLYKISTQIVENIDEINN